jgi:hypothetical protein
MPLPEHEDGSFYIKGKRDRFKWGGVAILDKVLNQLRILAFILTCAPYGIVTHASGTNN